MIIKLDKPISQKEAWEIIKPVCRELYDLTNAGNIHFASGSYNESSGMYKINLKCSRIHLASRGFKDSIGDIEYQQGNIRIGLRANGIPANLYRADLTRYYLEITIYSASDISANVTHA